MFAALNAWTLPTDATPHSQLEIAVAAGFRGIELTLSDDGPLTFDTALQDFNALRRRAAEAGLEIVALATAAFFEQNYASADAADRRRARERTIAMLDRAAAAGAGAILVVPAVVGTAAEPAPRVAYADAMNRSLEALLELRHEAEARGVTIAIENVWNRFLLSPIEACGFLDEVNSPYVEWYFDTGNVLTFGYPQDWIATLGGHIVRVHAKDYDLGRPEHAGFCALGAGDVDWPAVTAALRAVGYDGALTYEGDGDPREIRRRLENIIAGRAPTEDEPPL